jgi:hypothetical protein
VREDRQQPALDVGQPAVDDGEQGDRSRGGRRRRVGWSAERLQLTSGGAVDHVPATVAKLPSNRVGGLEVTRPATLDSFVEEP